MKTCTTCMVEKETRFFLIDRRNGKPMSKCKACRSSAARAWRHSKPEYEKSRYQAVKVETRERHLKRKYGVDLGLYAKMLADQDNRCAICRAPESEQLNGVFHVDHCHETGKVRGLLCRGCNHMLGVVGDDPKILVRAIQYLVPQVAAEVIGAYLDMKRDAA